MIAGHISIERIVKKLHGVLDGRTVCEGDSVSLTLSWRITVGGGGGGLHVEPIITPKSSSAPIGVS